MGLPDQGVPPVRLGDVVRVEHDLGPQVAGGERDARAVEGPGLEGLPDGELVGGGLGEVEGEGGALAVLGVVLGGAVGHLDDEAAGVADDQRQQEVAGDEVGVDAEPDHPQAVGE
jgi:hypothetical protein